MMVEDQMADALEGTVDLLSGMAFRATGGSGHSITLDAAPEHGGTDEGLRPMELLLLGLGGCTGMDVIGILRKARQEVTGYQVHLHGDRADNHPRVFTTITVEHVVRGRNLSVEAVRRAIELSATKYCSASAMLGKTARLEARFCVIDEAAGTEIEGTL